MPDARSSGPIVGGTAAYACDRCGERHGVQAPKCKRCGVYGSVQHAVITSSPSGTSPRPFPMNGRASTTSNSRPAQPRSSDGPIPITQVQRTSADRRAIPTGFVELDSMFGANVGGGIPRAAVFFVSGGPGIGKSTMLLDLLGRIAARGMVQASGAQPSEFQQTTGEVDGLAGERMLYIAAEEDEERILDRAERLGVACDELHIKSTKDIIPVARWVRELRPNLVVIDSLNEIHLGKVCDLGEQAEMKAIAEEINRLPKINGATIFVVGHVTKDGSIAGPMKVQHKFDGTFFFERLDHLRSMRSLKNRFAPDARALFRMTTKHGLVPVENPSEALLRYRRRELPGSVVAPWMEDPTSNRSILVEVQARLALGVGAVTGANEKRILQRVPVIAEWLNLTHPDEDRPAMAANNVSINVPGGIQAKETAMDLALAVAIASSALGRVPREACYFGELGLPGEVRGVGGSTARLLEAKTSGYTIAVVPHGSGEDDDGADFGDLEIVEVSTLGEALEFAFPEEDPAFGGTSDNPAAGGTKRQRTKKSRAKKPSRGRAGRRKIT